MSRLVKSGFTYLRKCKLPPLIIPFYTEISVFSRTEKRAFLNFKSEKYAATLLNFTKIFSASETSKFQKQRDLPRLEKKYDF